MYKLRMYFWCVLLISSTAKATIKLPIELTSWTIHPTVATIKLPIGSEIKQISGLYLRIHNLKFANQLSVRLNEGGWHHVNNDTVEVFENEALQDGIGGINATIRLIANALNDDFVSGGENHLHIRLNGTNGETSAIRMIALNVMAADGSMLLEEADFLQDDPSSWQPILNDPISLSAGEELWHSANLYNNPITKRTLKAKCSSCHFEDGSDLKYFNYSDQSIITRAQFHGLSYADGVRIASYIRALETPAPGRPWNPPFQPGPGLDPLPTDTDQIKQQKADHWMAGAGLHWALDDEAQVMAHMFPDGVTWGNMSALYDRNKVLSLRVLPVAQQMPDWNMWLPKAAPEDIWPDASDYEVPWTLFNVVADALANEGPAALAASAQLQNLFGRFNWDLDGWHGDIRGGAGPESEVGLRRNPEFSRETHIQALQRWKSIKIYDLVRKYGLEDIHDDESVWHQRGDTEFTNELLAIPGNRPRANIWALAPHIISNNIRHFEGQWDRTGTMESNQWYHLASLVTSGHRVQANQNVPMDWNYIFEHYERAYQRTGSYNSVTRVATLAKVLQARDTGAGMTRDGYVAHAMQLNKRFSYDDYDRRSFSYLDTLSPDMWRMSFEAYLHEWLDMHESYAVNDEAAIPRDDLSQYYYETSQTVPEPGVGFSGFHGPREKQHINNFYRLLPLLQQQGIDELTLTDLANWFNRMWPYDANRWGSVPSWHELITSVSLLAENFENNSIFSGLTPVPIKDSNGVNLTAVPKNGGSYYVGHRYIGGGTPTMTAALSGDISGLSAFKIRARVAFVKSGGGEGMPDLRLGFISNAESRVSSALPINLGILAEKFQTIEVIFEPNNSSTALQEVFIRALNLNNVQGDLYVDNVVVIPVVNEANDTQAPPVPQLNVRDDILARPDRPFVRMYWNSLDEADLLGYRLYRRDATAAASARKLLGNGVVVKSLNAINDESVVPGVTYIYEVTSVDESGNESNFSNEVTVTLPDITATHIPAEIWAINGINQIEVGGFGVPDIDLQGFELYRRSANSGAEFELIQTAVNNSDTLYFSDAAVQLGQSYEYYIKAIDRNGLSASTAPISLLHEKPHLQATEFIHVTFENAKTNHYDVHVVLTEALAQNIEIQLEVDGRALPTVYAFTAAGGNQFTLPAVYLTEGPRALTLVVLSGEMQIESINYALNQDYIFANGFEK
ncbi:hypothetical protein OS175_11575 [Marinicella sp. S1101]|uniref:fibronectin type III domain-containing protein n=1 Tax=Marinicella marina TaxID=2996016 RepID=UPI002260A443|nr:hypothetical protein [Marinicella marina]MCX7554524.1 hypothetical protein [Marinicella marina]MDJ1140675.1 hypothetical protein [Marinicella marina]